MLADTYKTFIYSSIFCTLFLVDYMLGDGLVNGVQKILCNIVCFVRSLKGKPDLPTAENSTTSVTVLFLEILTLSLSLTVLYKFKDYRSKDRIDDLLQESKDTLRQTNDFLEKWRLRRIPTEQSYLDEEPEQIKPYTLEVPILHMAIVDTLAPSRNQPESGDAGDSISVTDSTLLSATSLVGDLDNTEAVIDAKIKEGLKSVDMNDRYLWDVAEEDPNADELV